MSSAVGRVSGETTIASNSGRRTGSSASESGTTVARPGAISRQRRRTSAARSRYGRTPAAGPRARATRGSVVTPTRTRSPTSAAAWRSARWPTWRRLNVPPTHTTLLPPITGAPPSAARRAGPGARSSRWPRTSRARTTCACAPRAPAAPRRPRCTSSGLAGWPSRRTGSACAGSAWPLRSPTAQAGRRISRLRPRRRGLTRPRRPGRPGQAPRSGSAKASRPGSSSTRRSPRS